MASGPGIPTTLARYGTTWTAWEGCSPQVIRFAKPLLSPFPSDSAVDVLDGGDGNDYLDAENRPAARDIVSCGAGRDFAFVDRKDIVSGCEAAW